MRPHLHGIIVHTEVGRGHSGTIATGCSTSSSPTTSPRSTDPAATSGPPTTATHVNGHVSTDATRSSPSNSGHNISTPAGTAAHYASPEIGSIGSQCGGQRSGRRNRSRASTRNRRRHDRASITGGGRLALSLLNKLLTKRLSTVQYYSNRSRPRRLSNEMRPLK
jgi:hypothetical protein